MTLEQKLNEIAEILEVEIDELSENSVLENFETWDSVAVLSIIAVMNEKFNKFPTAAEIKSYITVGDIVKMME